MAFHEIAGNRAIHNILRRALERGRVPNSILFCGPQGVGKRRTARALAQALNCLNLKGGEACGVCRSCVAIAGRKFPDVVEYEIPKDKRDLKGKKDSPEDKTDSFKEETAVKEEKKGEDDKTVITIKQMKELRGLAVLKPMVGRRRVFIVDEAESMSEEAANAILKILEEPPLFIQIVLLSENRESILPTILSRCRVLTFLPVSDEEVERSLRDIGVDAEKARIMALVCRGNIEKALEMDWDEIQAGRREAWSLFSALADESDPGALMKKYAYKREGGKRAAVKDELAGLLELLSTFGRDAVLLGEGGDPRLLFNPDFEAELRDAASRLTPGRALRLIGLLHRAAASNDKNGHFGALTTSLTAQWLKADEAR